MAIIIHKRYLNRIKRELSALDAQHQWDYISKELEYFREKNSGEEADEIIKWFEGRLFSIERQMIVPNKLSKGKRRTEKSFNWMGSDKLLRELYEGMKEHLIAEETPWDEFRMVFNQSSLEEVKKLDWKKTTSLLAYFIYSLKSSNNIISMADNHWIIAESCFTKAKNLRQFNDNRSSLGMQIRGAHFVKELFKTRLGIILSE